MDDPSTPAQHLHEKYVVTCMSEDIPSPRLAPLTLFTSTLLSMLSPRRFLFFSSSLIEDFPRYLRLANYYSSFWAHNRDVVSTNNRIYRISTCCGLPLDTSSYAQQNKVSQTGPLCASCYFHRIPPLFTSTTLLFYIVWYSHQGLDCNAEYCRFGRPAPVQPWMYLDSSDVLRFIAQISLCQSGGWSLLAISTSGFAFLRLSELRLFAESMQEPVVMKGPFGAVGYMTLIY